MSIQQMLLGASGASGYLMDKSLRFRASASAYLNRTPSVSGNRKTWTWSGWVKRGSIGTLQTLFSSGVAAGDVVILQFATSGGAAGDSLNLYTHPNSITTTQVFRDPSAWYHVVWALDTTQATEANRSRLYINGVQVTAISGTYPVLNQDYGVNQATTPHALGRYVYTSDRYFDGYLADVNFVDGQALTPSSFGETNALTGVWQPKAYTGTYGTNGFYLDFEDTSSVAALGTDKSGNGNTWTVNNISLTAGVTYDSMTDVPTLTSATAANYCVLNPLDKQANFTSLDANLAARISSQIALQRATFALPSSGKFYYEMSSNLSTDNNNAVGFGLCLGSRSLTAGVGQTGDLIAYLIASVLLFNGGSSVSAGSPPAANVPMRFAADVTNGKFWIGNATVWYNSTGGTTGDPATGANPTFTTSLVGLFPCIYSDNTSNATLYANFGQRPFTYTPPTGFVALNTFNLPTATILKGNTVMDATLYTGNGSTQTITNAAGFQPDLVWAKGRSGATDHALYDSVRGVEKQLESNTTDAETTQTTGLTAFGSTGFSIGALAQMNTNAATYVAWQWQAGQGTTSSNTNGSITSTVSVNATAGFSVVTFTSQASGAGTIGHGLGVAPSLIIVKDRGLTSNWAVYHSSVVTTTNVYLTLNTINALGTQAGVWGSSLPTSSVFGITSGTTVQSSDTCVAYCFAEINGFSKFGSYNGNGSSDGPFVYLGFRPKFLLLKSSTNGSYGWTLWDSSRNTFNFLDKYLQANNANAEETFGVPDFLSNGFKIRTNNASVNENGGTMIYAAFAENPFKNSLAR